MTETKGTEMFHGGKHVILNPIDTLGSVLVTLIGSIMEYLTSVRKVFGSGG